jgi:xanthine dehydrogenase YagS FAD-binding subunit
MRSFDYTSPKQKQQAVGLLGQHWNDAEVLAGGSDLLGLMKDDVVHPKRLVNVKDLDELRGISFSQQRGLRIGALMTLIEISEDSHVKQHYPMLAHAAGDAASPQIRNVASIGGNMCQRPRCWWFRNGFGLLAMGPDGKSLVLDGDNRHHAILGNEGPAYFVSPSTVAPALIAYNARIRLFGPDGSREIPLEKFFVIPRSEGEREHDLHPNEIVTDIVVPVPPAGAKAAHYEIRQKEAFDWPYATASVVLEMNGGSVRSARVVMSHVAPVPWVSNEAAQALAGKSVSEQTAEQAGAAAVANARSLGRNKHKITLARVAVKRAVLLAAQGERA